MSLHPFYLNLYNIGKSIDEKNTEIVEVKTLKYYKSIVDTYFINNVKCKCRTLIGNKQYGYVSLDTGKKEGTWIEWDNFLNVKTMCVYVDGICNIDYIKINIDGTFVHQKLNII
jgi:hypothetical protein